MQPLNFIPQSVGEFQDLIPRIHMFNRAKCIVLLMPVPPLHPAQHSISRQQRVRAYEGPLSRHVPLRAAEGGSDVTPVVGLVFICRDGLRRVPVVAERHAIAPDPTHLWGLFP